MAGAAALAVTALTVAAVSAEARVWVSLGYPFPGYSYGPGPYYPYPPADYAPPPSAYYPPATYPQPQGYPVPGAYPPPNMPGAPAYGLPPAGDEPSGAAVPAAPAQPEYAPLATAPAHPAPPKPTAGAAPGKLPGITYTNKPAFTNSAGQPCRQYKTTDMAKGYPVDVYGTACRHADGQWRVVD
jgi:hypothetical protein